MKLFTIPNLICYFRVLLAFYAFYDFLQSHDDWMFLILTIIVIALDGIDGMVARALDQATSLGAKIDIAADRIVELAYWFFFAYIGLLGFWVFGFFLVRGLLVDWLSRKHDKPLGNSWLRSSRFMRAFYGILKVLSFAMLIMLPGLSYQAWNITNLVVYLTVLVCFLRAWPVFRQVIS